MRGTTPWLTLRTLDQGPVGVKAAQTFWEGLDTVVLYAEFPVLESGVREYFVGLSAEPGIVPWIVEPVGTHTIHAGDSLAVRLKFVVASINGAALQ
jgi:hypothetical protein